MSFAIGLLGKAVAVCVAGVGILVPTANAFGSAPERVKLEKKEDLKNLCLIVLQENESASRELKDNKNKKLLACQRDNNPATTEFFFYDSSRDFDVSEIKKVKHIKTISGNTTAVLVLEKEGNESSVAEKEETIQNLRPRIWSPLREIDLKSKTKVDMQEKKIYFYDIWTQRSIELTELTSD